jgi:hypothetical protein
MAYVKLDTSILTSTLWMHRDDRDLFVTALLLAEPLELLEEVPAIGVRTPDPTGFVVPPGWYGFANAAGIGIIAAARHISNEDGMEALERLCGPEPDSRNPKFDGRRLARIAPPRDGGQGGYLILNYMDYRDRDHTAAERMRRLRKRKREQQNADNSDGRDGVTLRNSDARDVTSRATLRIADADAVTTTILSNDNIGASGTADGKTETDETAVQNEPVTDWKADAAVTMRASGVEESAIGDALRNFWPAARRRFSDEEIHATVKAVGLQFQARGETWNPARVWNPRNERFDEMFRDIVAKVRRQGGRTRTHGLTALADVLNKQG